MSAAAPGAVAFQTILGTAQQQANIEERLLSEAGGHASVTTHACAHADDTSEAVNCINRFRTHWFCPAYCSPRGWYPEGI